MEMHLEEQSLEVAMGSRLKARRLAMGLSVGDLARLSAVPIVVLKNAEDGTGRLRPETLIALREHSTSVRAGFLTAFASRVLAC